MCKLHACSTTSVNTSDTFHYKAPQDVVVEDDSHHSHKSHAPAEDDIESEVNKEPKPITMMQELLLYVFSSPKDALSHNQNLTFYMMFVFH